MVVVKKGYTLTVVSWENDGDNYNTITKTVDTIEEAKVWWNMMQLCSNGSETLGNSYGEFSRKQQKIAIDFMNENRSILIPLEDRIVDDEMLVDWFCDLAGELLGHSEYYACRVMDSCKVTYSPVDIEVEDVKFS